MVRTVAAPWGRRERDERGKQGWRRSAALKRWNPDVCGKQIN